MGARTTDTLKEIDAIRRRLDERLSELERRVPAVAGASKKAVAALVGSGAATIVAKGVAKRVFSRGGKKAVAQAAPVVVRVLPAGTIPAALAIAGVWAAIRLYEARTRAQAAGGERREAPGRLYPLPKRAER